MEAVLEAINNVKNDYGKSLYDIIIDQKAGVATIILENFETIFDSCSEYGKMHFLQLLKRNELEDIIYAKFEYLLITLKQDPILLKKLFKILDNKEFISDNIEFIVNTVGKGYIYSTTHILKFIEDIDRDKINLILENNKEEVVKEILKNSIMGSGKYLGKWNLIKDEIESYIPTIKIIIDELLQQENKRWIDISVLERGYYVTAFEIGNKVLKIGTTDGKYEVSNHRRILQPLARFRFGKNKGCALEIQEKVETGRFPIDELYKVYKELRDDGILATDFKPQNVGRLTKPNIVHFDGIDSVAPEAIGFDKEIESDKVLPKGELVLFDLGYIFKYQKDQNTDGEDIIRWPSEFALDMEERYEREKNRGRVDFER